MSTARRVLAHPVGVLLLATAVFAAGVTFGEAAAAISGVFAAAAWAASFSLEHAEPGL